MQRNMQIGLLADTAMRYIAFALFVASGSISTSATAANWGFLKDAPIAYFTKDDMALFTSALEKGLDGSPDGTRITWSNPDTRAGGVLTFVESRELKAKRCRLVKIENKARGRAGGTSKWFCKESSGEWKLHQQ